MVVKVSINGYGTIGKRIADAILKQDDMEIIGVAKRTPDFNAVIAFKSGIPILFRIMSKNLKKLASRLQVLLKT